MKKKFLYNRRLAAPVNVTWEITHRCNLHCRHCLSAGTMANCNEDMSLDESYAFIDDMAKMRVFQVNIGGGEPCLREDLLAILDYCHSRGIVTCLSTNGTLLNSDLARRFSEMELLYIQVSLDGATAETNAQLRGEGTFERAIEGIKLLNKFNFPNLSINTVVTRVNFREIDKIYAMGKQFNAKTRLSRFRPSGRAKDAWKNFHLTKEQNRELAGYLSKYQDILTGDSFFSITNDDRKHLGLNMCGAAKMTCSVTPDGRVYPCAFLQEDRFLAGNILNDFLGDIWRDAEIFETFRNLKVEACETCPRFDICHGGCPAVAYFLKHELNCPDPECIQQVEAFGESVG